MSKNEINHIINTLGWEKIADGVEVGWHMIRHAKNTGLFPAPWYNVLKFMCDEAGIPCPLSLFRWKVQANKVSRSSADAQEASP